MATPDLDVIKDIPGYKVILKAVLKSQIQQLVEQLAISTDEESVILTASVSDGTLSHLGSDSGKNFLEDHEDIKSQFLGFCLKRHHKRKQEKEQEEAMKKMQSTPPRYGGPPVNYLQMRSPTQISPRHPGPIPVSLTRVSPMTRHAPYPRGRPPRRMPPSLSGPGHGGPPPRQSVLGNSPNSENSSAVIKIEPDDEDSNQSASDSNARTAAPSEAQASNQPLSSPSTPVAQSPSVIKSDSSEQNDPDASNQDDGSDAMPVEGLSLDSDLSNLIPKELSEDTAKSGVSDETSGDNSVSIKVEAVTESEMELEITGVEPGRLNVSQDSSDSWGQSSSGAYSMGATATSPQDYSGILDANALDSHLPIESQHRTNPITFLRQHSGERHAFTERQTLTEGPSLTLRQYSSKRRTSAELPSSAERLTTDRSGKQRYACTLCEKDFASPSALDTHVRSHTGEKPFTCHICQRSFAVKSSYLRHQIVHMNK